MSTEELKMIMDALSSLGANGKEAFIWWMIVSYGSRVVLGLMLLTGAVGIPYVITKAIAAHSSRGRALQTIGEAVGVKFYPWAEYHSPGERIEDVVNNVRRLSGK
jgi:hypothetical protein